MQNTQVEILKRKAKSFTGSDGEERDYFWYTALRESDGVTFTFGSSNQYEEGEELDLPILKVESANGKILYKEDTSR